MLIILYHYRLREFHITQTNGVQLKTASRIRVALQRINVNLFKHIVNIAVGHSCADLDAVLTTRLQRLLIHPHDVSRKAVPHGWLTIGMHQKITAGNIYLIFQSQRDGIPRPGPINLALVGMDTFDP